MPAAAPDLRKNGGIGHCCGCNQLVGSRDCVSLSRLLLAGLPLRIGALTSVSAQLPHIDALATGTHMITIEGVAQCYHVFGQGPLCVAHSGGPGIEWGYLRMPELEAHLTMIYVEPIGTGASGRLAEHPRGYSVARYSQQLQGLVEALDLSDILLLGHSHGGFVAQHHALARPERLAGIILYDSSPVTGGDFMADAFRNIEDFGRRHAGTADANEVLQAWRSIPSITSDAEFTAVIRSLLPAYFADDRRADFVDQLRPSLHASFVIGDGDPFDVREALRQLAVPALVLVGQHDFICGPRWADMLHDLIPHSRLVPFNRSGHFAHIEQPKEFVEAVTSFSVEVLHP